MDNKDQSAAVAALRSLAGAVPPGESGKLRWMQLAADISDHFAEVRRDISDPVRDSIAVEEYIYEPNGPWIYRLQIIFKVEFFQNPEDGHCFYLRTPNALRVWYRDKADRNLNILPPAKLDELINIDRHGISWEECWWPHYPEAGHKEPIRAIYAEVTRTPTDDPEVFEASVKFSEAVHRGLGV